MKKKFSHADLNRNNQAITNAMHLRGRTVAYAMTRNQRKFEAELKDMEKSAPQPEKELIDKVKAFQDEQFKIALKYATQQTGANGQGVNIARDIPADKREAYYKEIEKFRAKKDNAETIARMEAVEQARVEFFGNPELVAEVDVYMVSLSDFPEDVDGRTVDGLEFMIAEESNGV